jgi:hypothetical protein
MPTTPSLDTPAAATTRRACTATFTPCATPVSTPDASVPVDAPSVLRLVVFNTCRSAEGRWVYRVTIRPDADHHEPYLLHRVLTGATVWWEEDGHEMSGAMQAMWTGTTLAEQPYEQLCAFTSEEFSSTATQVRVQLHVGSQTLEVEHEVPLRRRQRDFGALGATQHAVRFEANSASLVGAMAEDTFRGDFRAYEAWRVAAGPGERTAHAESFANRLRQNEEVEEREAEATLERAEERKEAAAVRAAAAAAAEATRAQERELAGVPELERPHEHLCPITGEPFTEPVCYAMRCDAMRCDAMLCCAMPCSVLCYAMLCYAMPCYARSPPPTASATSGGRSSGGSRSTA